MSRPFLADLSPRETACLARFCRLLLRQTDVAIHRLAEDIDHAILTAELLGRLERAHWVALDLSARRAVLVHRGSVVAWLREIDALGLPHPRQLGLFAGAPS